MFFLKVSEAQTLAFKGVYTLVCFTAHTKWVDWIRELSHLFKIRFTRPNVKAAPLPPERRISLSYTSVSGRDPYGPSIEAH